MSQPDAAYRFLSWLRRGAATQIHAKDQQATAAARATVPVEVAFNGGAQAASLSLDLLGPGDVAGFDARAIVRVWPPPETLDAEPNYFPLVECDQVDLPWRYTPRAGNDAGRLRPWFCLVALKESELAYEPSRPDRALGKVTIAAGTPMPRIDQAWAWAHVQISGDDDVPLASVIATQPGRCVARLLCPRRLDPRTRYWAMLVPIFEVGRRAGLRLALEGTDSALADAWSTSPDGTLAAALELPVYHRWRFGTGEGGDFESLVARIKPGSLPATVGTRELDVSSAGGGLPAAASTPLLIGGALQAPESLPGAWPSEERDAFVEELARLLDLPATVRVAGGTPVVAPPLYGAWHARRERLEATNPPPWFENLNADPRNRVAAALGTEVVQAQQQALMASAWEQVAGIREANDQLRKAQLARLIGEQLHLRFVRPADADTVLTFSASALGHVRHTTTTTTTVRALVKHSPSRLALVAGTFRRLARPLGPLGRRQARPDRAVTPLVTRVNDGTYDKVLRSTPPAPTMLPTDGWLAEQGSPWKGAPSDKEIAAQPPLPKAVVWDPVYGKEPQPDSESGTEDSPSMARFRQAAIALAQRDAKPGAGDALRRLAMTGVRTSVVAALDPRVSIPAALGTRLVGAPGFAWDPPDPIEPVMAHPEFPQPMYKALAELSQDWVLPGLSEVPANTAAIALTNPAFIEAYLVGLNHEMARELMWNEYPTDQRGSYFRQFWDPAGLAPTPVPETAKDIKRLHAWPATSDLGQHSPRPAPPSPQGRHVVLLVRGEVLRRYPGTLVYAQRAEGPAGSRVLATEQRAPIFGGRLHPDVGFFGFDLSVEQARGTGGDPGWFFVFQEQPGEPRFGLDVSSTTTTPVSWDDLAWTHLAASPEALAQLGYIDLAAALPSTGALEIVGGAAWHVTATGPGRPVARGADHAAITMQRPVRVAVHESEMLPT